MTTYLSIIQIIISIVLTILILLQVKGGAFGTSSDSSVFRTRRGVERTIFQLTIFFAFLFILVAMAAVLVSRV
ncbi:MAG: preprotein translocase subunit SecG [Chloroflexi bacterium]|nr:preprotein translocase subunit SecG [Chloroflexota bacterium]